jgi:hypothetical protein
MSAPTVELDFSPKALSPTCQRFAASSAFVRFIVGPVGSGKSTACVREIARRALRQKPGPDGIRRSRFAVIRNTYSQLRDTTRKTFEQWIPANLGRWHEQSFTFEMRFADVHCEVLFRALDRPEDVKKLLSLELTGAYINEVREIPKNVLDVLQTRVGRYPSKAQGGATWFGIWADTNPWHAGHWGAKLFAKNLDGYEIFRQPGGRTPKAENIENLPAGYYERLVAGKDSEYVRVYVDGEDASGAIGAIWGPWIAKLEQRGGVCAFDHPADGVFLNWDLGRSDSTAIWAWRINRHGVADFINHYENVGQGLSHYFDVVKEWKYGIEKVWLPHDARAETLATKQSVLEQCIAHYGAGRVGIVPDIGVDDGISAARWMLEQPVLIHERCGVPARLEYSGLDALREYRFEWDEDGQCFSRVPLHNWASHTADAFRYVAVVVKVCDLFSRKPTPPEDAIARALKPPTLDELFEMQPRSSGRI